MAMDKAAAEKFVSNARNRRWDLVLQGRPLGARLLVVAGRRLGGDVAADAACPLPAAKAIHATAVAGVLLPEFLFKFRP